MNNFLQTALAAGCLMLLAACSSQASRNNTPATVQAVTGKSQIQGQIVGKIAATNKFAPLRIGMTRNEVEILVGRPTEIGAQSTGTAWVPYYFGSDTWSTESYYQGHGRLVFNADSYLVLIDVSENACK